MYLLYDWDIKENVRFVLFFVGILGDIEQSAFPYYTFPFEYLIISRYGFICVCFVLSRKYESYHSTYQRKYRGIR